MATAKDDVNAARRGIVASVDTRKSMMHHRGHLEYEMEMFKRGPGITTRVSLILMKHMEGHYLAIRLKGR
jgi:hypothetical protein